MRTPCFPDLVHQFRPHLHQSRLVRRGHSIIDSHQSLHDLRSRILVHVRASQHSPGKHTGHHGVQHIVDLPVIQIPHTPVTNHVHHTGDSLHHLQHIGCRGGKRIQPGRHFFHESRQIRGNHPFQQVHQLGYRRNVFRQMGVIRDNCLGQSISPHGLLDHGKGLLRFVINGPSLLESSLPINP